MRVTRNKRQLSSFKRSQGEIQADESCTEGFQNLDSGDWGWGREKKRYILSQCFKTKCHLSNHYISLINSISSHAIFIGYIYLFSRVLYVEQPLFPSQLFLHSMTLVLLKSVWRCGKVCFTVTSSLWQKTSSMAFLVCRHNG